MSNHKLELEPNSNYTQLEGTEVVYIAGSPFDAIVIGCDYDIGITILTKNTNRKCLCLNKLASYSRTERTYKERFLGIVQLIKTGTISAKDLDILYYGRVSENGTRIGPCAFLGE